MNPNAAGFQPRLGSLMSAATASAFVPQQLMLQATATTTTTTTQQALSQAQVSPMMQFASSSSSYDDSGENVDIGGDASFGDAADDGFQYDYAPQDDAGDAPFMMPFQSMQQSPVGDAYNAFGTRSLLCAAPRDARVSLTKNARPFVPSASPVVGEWSKSLYLAEATPPNLSPTVTSLAFDPFEDLLWSGVAHVTVFFFRCRRTTLSTKRAPVCVSVLAALRVEFIRI